MIVGDWLYLRPEGNRTLSTTPIYGLLRTKYGLATQCSFARFTRLTKGIICLVPVQEVFDISLLLRDPISDGALNPKVALMPRNIEGFKGGRVGDGRLNRCATLAEAFTFLWSFWHYVAVVQRSQLHKLFSKCRWDSHITKLLFVDYVCVGCVSLICLVFHKMTSNTYHFEVLQLTKTCFEVEIKKAFRELGLRWHPNKNKTWYANATNMSANYKLGEQKRG